MNSLNRGSSYSREKGEEVLLYRGGHLMLGKSFGPSWHLAGRASPSLFHSFYNCVTVHRWREERLTNGITESANGNQ
jgi:hypothetical protein